MKLLFFWKLCVSHQEMKQVSYWIKKAPSGIEQVFVNYQENVNFVFDQNYNDLVMARKRIRATIRLMEKNQNSYWIDKSLADHETQIQSLRFFLDVIRSAIKQKS